MTRRRNELESLVGLQAPWSAYQFVFDQSVLDPFVLDIYTELCTISSG